MIRGWDEGVAKVWWHVCRSCLNSLASRSQMSVGERAILTCSPDYAYGAAGAGGVYPL